MFPYFSIEELEKNLFHIKNKRKSHASNKYSRKKELELIKGIWEKIGKEKR